MLGGIFAQQQGERTGGVGNVAVGNGVATTATPSPVSGANKTVPVVSPGDEAYCQGSGKLVQVAETENWRAAVCAQASQFIYRGLNKLDGLAIKLPAEKTSGGFVGHNTAARTDYILTPDTFSITQNGSEIASQPMTEWWIPSDGNPPLGDLGLSEPISVPPCDGAAVVILGTSYQPSAYAAEVQALLDANPGSTYLRTDLSCESFFRPSVANSNGNYVYAVYKKVGSNQGEACAAIRATGGYGKWLRNDMDPKLRIEC
jgi:hypothetical protein